MSKPEINVTPLIDVLLVLLIIFMVVTPIKPSKFEAKIPSEPDKDFRTEVEPATLIVTVGLDSSLRINKEHTGATVKSPEPLTTKLSETFKLRQQNSVKEKTVFIKAPKAVSYGNVAKVVDAVKMSGAFPISLQIDDLD